MKEQPQSESEQKTKTYKSSLEEVLDYLEEKTKKSRQRRSEGKEPSLEEIFTNASDVYKGFKFFKEKGPALKSIGKETVKSVLHNPFAWEDVLIQGVAKTQQTVATHMSEQVEGKLKVKAETLKTISDVEAEEQRLATLRANLEAAEQILKTKKEEVFTSGRKIDTPDPMDSLKNSVDQAFRKRRTNNQQATESFINQLFGSL